MLYVGEYGAKFSGLAVQSKLFDRTARVCAGKFRRYHGASLLERLLDVRTLLLNIRDVVLAVTGTLQAIVLVGKYRPDVIFLKGGYVGVPIGLAGAFWRVPMLTHDSDAIPGLANRLVGRWARLHAVAARPDTYPYPAEKTVSVGVLVEAAYRAVDEQQQRVYKTEIGISADEQMLLVTGGSLGAVAINESVAALVDGLLRDYPTLRVVHQVGKGKAGVYGGYRHERLTVLEFLRPMASYTGAADLVVCRGSANTLAELGVQGKAVVAVPSPHLANGHQLRNAELLAEQGSAAVVPQDMLYDEQQGLDVTVRSLLDNSAGRRALGKRLQAQYPTDAAQRVAELIVKLAESTSKSEAD